MEAVVVLYEGVSALEALGAHAALRAAGWPAELVAPEALVRAQGDVRLVPTRLGVEPIERAAAVLLPGGDITAPLRDAALVRALRARRGHWTLASGEALRLAQAAGLTEGRRVARGPGEAAIPGATSVASRLVADGRLLTSFGGDAAIDLALHLVEMVDGADAAARAAHELGRERRTFAFGETHAGR